MSFRLINIANKRRLTCIKLSTQYFAPAWPPWLSILLRQRVWPRTFPLLARLSKHLESRTTIGPGSMLVAMSDTPEDTGATRCSIRDPTAASSSFGSIFGGLQFGYNYRLPSRLLVGIEGDISFPNYLDDGIVASRSTPSSAVTEKLDFVSTVRGRAGYAFDHWLFYATGGARLVASAVP